MRVFHKTLCLCTGRDWNLFKVSPKAQGFAPKKEVQLYFKILCQQLHLPISMALFVYISECHLNHIEITCSNSLIAKF